MQTKSCAPLPVLSAESVAISRYSLAMLTGLREQPCVEQSVRLPISPHAAQAITERRYSIFPTRLFTYSASMKLSGMLCFEAAALETAPPY
jgi:hypothetical protein